MNKFITIRKILKRISHGELNTTVTSLYALLICIAATFLIYMSIFQNINVYKARPEPFYNIVEDKEISEISDESTPIGKKIEYKWKLNDINRSDNYMIFYLVHQYAEVYFDGNLIYSLKMDEGNKIGKTTGCNWVSIPIYSEDIGTEVCVDIIPVYEAVKDKPVIFFVGSKSSIYSSILKNELPQILFSLIAIAIGISFVIISIFRKYKQNENISIIYLGIFSLSIGLWKITDLYASPLLFSKNPMALSYISFTMILLSIITWTLSIKEQFFKKSSVILEWSNIIFCIVSLGIMVAQIINIVDFRQTLFITHIIIIMAALVTIGAVIYKGKNKRIDKKTKILYTCIMLCIDGMFIDMISYYVKGYSTGILYTLIAFIIYVVTMGYIAIREINKKANVDMHTGVYNKSRCNELLDENEEILDPLSIIMFDLNGLKYTNDTFGHDKGDMLILEFANILRKNISNRDFIGRYGGDEFIAIIKETDEEQILEINDSIGKSVERYNLKNNGIYLSYSMGYVLSTNYPECTLRELLKKADYYMYRNKKSYHNA